MYHLNKKFSVMFLAINLDLAKVKEIILVKYLMNIQFSPLRKY